MSGQKYRNLQDTLIYVKYIVRKFTSKEVWKYGSMEVWKYESMQVCKYASMQVCKYVSIQVCNRTCMYVEIYTNLQVWKYA